MDTRAAEEVIQVVVSLLERGDDWEGFWGEAAF